MSKFIWVFTAEDRDRLLGCGCHLIKSDDKNNVYIFRNQRLDDECRLEYGIETMVFTNTLTF